MSSQDQGAPDMTDQSAHAPLDEPNTDLSSNRTGMSFERTAMSADRTLMSVMRTALSLISFGFTIYQFISKFTDQKPHAAVAARNFGVTLIVLGIGILVVGLGDHFRELRGLHQRRQVLYAADLLHRGTPYRPSSIGVVALLLLIVGLVAIVGMVLRTGPFG
jgi:putative membrane protein